MKGKGKKSKGKGKDKDKGKGKRKGGGKGKDKDKGKNNGKAGWYDPPPEYLKETKATETYKQVAKRKGEDDKFPCLKKLIEGKCVNEKCQFSHDEEKHKFTDLEKEHVKSELGRNRKNREIQKIRRKYFVIQVSTHIGESVHTWIIKYFLIGIYIDEPDYRTITAFLLNLLTFL